MRRIFARLAVVAALAPVVSALLSCTGSDPLGADNGNLDAVLDVTTTPGPDEDAAKGYARIALDFNGIRVRSLNPVDAQVYDGMYTFPSYDPEQPLRFDLASAPMSYSIASILLNSGPYVVEEVQFNQIVLTGPPTDTCPAGAKTTFSSSSPNWYVVRPDLPLTISTGGRQTVRLIVDRSMLVKAVTMTPPDSVTECSIVTQNVEAFSANVEQLGAITIRIE